MDRVAELREFITKDQLGIEIGPWFKPIAPKSMGYHSLALDVFDGAELRRRGQNDPGVPDEMVCNIEDVDLKGSATHLAELVAERGLTGQVDYMVSSHNFEHIPDPVRFLQDCQTVLKPGGVLSMAIPDGRGCFDFFRPHSTTGNLLDAFWQRRDRPTPGQTFDMFSLSACRNADGIDQIGWAFDADASNIRALGSVESGSSQASLQQAETTYIDVHCWVFTPASFELIVSDLQSLGLLRMRLKKISGPNLDFCSEFFTHFSNETPDTSPATPESSIRRRTDMLHRVNDEAVAYSLAMTAHKRKTRELLEATIKELSL